MILPTGPPLSRAGERVRRYAVGGHTVRRDAGGRCRMRIAPQYPVGARFEARHIAGDELGPDRDGAVVELEAARRCAKPRYTRSGAMPAIVFTLLARPFPA